MVRMLRNTRPVRLLQGGGNLWGSELAQTHMSLVLDTEVPAACETIHLEAASTFS
jgi:hypothetical protein